MTRKLVTIRKIEEIRPIENADSIECATVGGWDIVVGKDQFKVGENALFFEVDSFLPIKEPFLFLEKSCKRTMGELIGLRLKTIKLRGQLSQGLLMPLSMFSDIDFSDEEKDYAEELVVIKYEPVVPACLAGVAEGMFPTNLIPKTDQNRIQNLPRYFEKYNDVKFEETEKLDGSSCTIYMCDGHFGVCSRNLELTETEGNSLWNIAKKYDIENKMREFISNIAIQGEIVGPGIQKNPLKLNEVDFYVYNIYNIDDKEYMESIFREELCRDFGLKHVPILRRVNILEIKTMREILGYVKGNSTINKQGRREGSVFKSTKLINGESIQFKVINNDYLLKNE